MPSQAALDAMLAEAYLEARKRVRKPKHTLEQYKNDPVGFVYDCITWDNPADGPTPYQVEILDALVTKRRVCVRSPHGAGKTCDVAWAALWFALTRDAVSDWKIVTTASAWRQLTKYLWPEIHKWVRRLDWGKLGRGPFDPRRELLALSIKLQTGEAFAVASTNPALIEGAHADEILYIYDEAKEIPSETFDASEGAFATGNAYGIAISTPGAPQGHFYDIQTKRDRYSNWFCRHVTVQEAIEANRMSSEWVEDMKRQWGETSAVYQNRVLGQFAASEEDSVVPLAWVEAANDRWQDWVDAGRKLVTFTCVGVDVARSGEDETVLAMRYGPVISDLIKHSKEDTMETTGRVVGILSSHPGGTAIVDVIGIGAGVVDRLTEQGYNVVPFNASERSLALDRSGQLGFADKRSEAWWSIREMLDPASGEDLALPYDDKLIGDLTCPRWRTMSGGKIRVESKDDIKKRLKRSTDSGDAVVMAFSNYVLGNEVEVLKL